MADLAQLEDLANGRVRRERNFRDQQDLLANDDEWLMSRFRLPRAVLLELCAVLGPALQRSTQSPSAASPTVRDGWLLGDSGYPLKRWLITPFHNPQSAEERQFNARHSQARAVVERTIGLLKGRWRCLDAIGGKLSYKPDKVCQIVRACAVLHNLAQLNNVPLPPEAACAQEEPDPLPQAFAQKTLVHCNSVWMTASVRTRPLLEGCTGGAVETPGLDARGAVETPGLDARAAVETPGLDARAAVETPGLDTGSSVDGSP
ncbi:putative nuclease HARBI1, partial [Dissostichus eleginoides]